MSYRLSDIVHETPDYFVIKVPTGFDLYRKDVTHARRCGQYGRGDKFRARAIQDADERQRKGPAR